MAILELEIEDGSPLRSFIDNLDRRFQRAAGGDEVMAAAAELFSTIMAGAARRGQGDPVPRVHGVRERAPRQGVRFSPFEPFSEFTPFTPFSGEQEPWFRPQKPPPRSPPPQQPPQAAPAIAAARKVLGFGPREPLTRPIVKARQRELARTHHPDAGGSNEAMAKVNRAADDLLAQLP
jgi:hypothetical protein